MSRQKLGQFQTKDNVTMLFCVLQQITLKFKSSVRFRFAPQKILCLSDGIHIWIVSGTRFDQIKKQCHIFVKTHERRFEYLSTPPAPFPMDVAWMISQCCIEKLRKRTKNLTEFLDRQGPFFPDPRLICSSSMKLSKMSWQDWRCVTKNRQQQLLHKNCNLAWMQKLMQQTPDNWILVLCTCIFSLMTSCHSSTNKVWHFFRRRTM